MRPGLILTALLLFVGPGCITPQFIANKAGFLSGTGYLAVNAPPAEEVKTVQKVLTLVTKYVDQLEPKDTFAKLYAPIKTEIEKELSGTLKNLALSVTRTVLDGLDTLFLSHPAWADEKELVVDLTRQFVAGVNQAFQTFGSSEEVRASMARLRTASVKAYRGRSP